VVRPARFLGGPLTALLACLPLPVLGQRIQFPTAVPTNVAGPMTEVNSSAGASGAAPSSGGGSAPSYNSGTAPQYGTTPPPSYGSGSAPNYTPLPDYTPPPGYGPNVAPGPGATFQGDIQPAPAWDPYGVPGSQAPTLLPTDPTLPSGPIYPEGTFAKMQRFLQQIRFDYFWIPGSASNELGLNEFDFSATFAVPFLYNTQTPLLITPGLGLHLWDGPVVPPQAIGFPPETYSAYLDAAWNPQVTQLVGCELAFRIGIYSDFDEVVNESIRYTGHGLAVLSFSPSFQIKAGVIYLDRQDIKLLPAGGIVWTPNSDIRFEILFPNPKLAKRITTYGNTDWWLYARGEYGGGCWTMKDVYLDGGGVVQPMTSPWEVDYNDMRFGVGLEFDRFSGAKGLFEVGVAFEREVFANGGELFRPDTTVFIRAALAL